MEVYAVGIHRGRPQGTRFTLQRTGPRPVVEGIQEHCQDDGQERRCRASTSVYLMAPAPCAPPRATPSSRLPRPTPRMAARSNTASAQRRLQRHRHRAHRAPQRSAKGQGGIRSSDLQRAFRLEQGQLVASGESLWTKTLRELVQKPVE